MVGRSKTLASSILLSLQFYLLLIATSCVHNIYREEYRCHRYLVAPPYHIDPFSSDLIREMWMNAALHELRPCDSFVQPAFASTVLSMIGLDHVRQLAPGDLSQQQRNTMGLQTGATHLVLLNYRVRANGQVRMQAEILRLYDMQPQALTMTRAYSTKPSAFEEQTLQAVDKNEWLYEQIDLIPNTITFGTVDSSLRNRREDQKRVRPCGSPKELTLLPPLISSLGITNVSHPYAYGRLDFDARWFPSIDVSYFNTEYRLAPDDVECAVAEANGTLANYRLEFLSIPLSFNGEVAMFSPIGTTYFQLGVGVSAFYFKDNEAGSSAGLRPVVRFGVGHRVFFRPEWMAQVGYDTLSADPSWFRSSRFELTDTYRAIFGFGYFFPTSRNAARRLGTRLFGR